MLKRLWLRTIDGLRRLRAGAEQLVDGRRVARQPVSREAVEAIVGRPVGDLELYVRALRHRSALRGQPDTHLLSNERLEFLGDAVLGLAVAEKLYAAFPDKDEGYLTRTRAKLVNGPTLADFARLLGLGKLLLLSPHLSGAEARDNPTILADAFEALIGAIYLDLGFEPARQFVLDIIEEYVDLEAIAEQRSNFKSLLLEAVQAEGWGQPIYEVAAEEGPSHDRRFTIDVYIEGKPLGRGHARSKKLAEQEAARQALDRLRTSSA